MSSFFEEPANVRSIRIHDVNLGRAAPIGYKSNLTSCLGIPDRRVVGALSRGQAVQILSVPIRDIDLRAGSVTAACKSDLAAVRRPGWRYRCATCAFKGVR